MAGRTPSEAYSTFIDSMNQALFCVTAGGRLFTSGDRRNLQVGEEYGVLLAGGGAAADDREDGEPIRLNSAARLWLGVAHTFVVKNDGPERTPYRISSIAYSYFFYDEVDHRRQEVIAFQWNKNAHPPERSYPHLHVNSVITNGSPFGPRSPFRPDKFHDLHIPTGRLSLEAVIMFAIEELKVETADNRTIATVLSLLREGDRRFHAERTQTGWAHLP